MVTSYFDAAQAEISVLEKRSADFDGVSAELVEKKRLLHNARRSLARAGEASQRVGRFEASHSSFVWSRGQFKPAASYARVIGILSKHKQRLLTPMGIDFENCRSVVSSPRRMMMLFSFESFRNMLEKWYNTRMKLASRSMVEICRVYFARGRAQLGRLKCERLVNDLTTNIDNSSGVRSRATVDCGDGVHLQQYMWSGDL